MTLDTVVHRNILINVLRDMYTQESVASSLGFKGGTAAMLFYGLNRFSVDLDFDLLDAAQEDFIFDVVKDILGRYGKVEARKKRYSLFFLLSYHDKPDNAQNIKVEINKRDFGSRYEIKQLLGISIAVMIQEDMFAHKLVAMHERIGEANRDIFDVCFFLGNRWPINKKIVEQRAHMSYAAFLQVSIDNLAALNDSGMLAGLGELLTPKQKAWVKTKLRSETIFLLRLALSNEA